MASLDGRHQQQSSALELSHERIASEIDAFIAKTGFPDLPTVSARIREHILSTVKEFFSDNSNLDPRYHFQIVYCGFDRDCSVARGNAIPGSDVDHLVVVVKAEKIQQAKSLWGSIRSLNPLSDKTAAPDGELDQVLQRFEKALASKLDKDLLDASQTITIGDMSYLTTVLAADEEADAKGEPLYADIRPLEIAKVLNNGYHLIGENAAPELLAQFLGFIEIRSKLGNTPKLDCWPDKLKYYARAELIKQFPNLRDAEKHLVINLLRESTEGALRILSAEPSGPWSAAVEALMGQGLLSRIDPHEAQTKAAMEALKPQVDWLARKYLAEGLQQVKIVAPWKCLYIDELILVWRDHPELRDRMITALEGNKSEGSAPPLAFQSRRNA